MSAMPKPVHEDGFVIVGDEAYLEDEWAALHHHKAKQAAYRERPEVKAQKAAYQQRPEVKAAHNRHQNERNAELRHLAQLAIEAGLGGDP
jgi:hypothetical protein